MSQNIQKVSNKQMRRFGLAALVVIIITMGLFSFYHLNKIDQNLNIIEQHNREELAGADELLADFVEIRGLFTSVVIYGQADLPLLLTKTESLIKKAGNFSEMLGEDEEKDLLIEFILELKKYRVAVVAYTQQRQTRIAGDGISVWEQTLMGIEKNAYRIIATLHDMVYLEINGLLTNIRVESQRGRALSVLLSFLGLLLGILVAALMQRAIASPMAELFAGARAIAAGDFNKQVDISSNDEVGEVGKAFNQMGAQLSATLVSKDYLGDVIQSIADILIILDKKAIIKEVNKAAIDQLGYDKAQMIGRGIDKFFSGTGDSLGMSSFLDKLLSGEVIRGYEVTCHASDKRTFPAIVSGGILRDREKNISDIVITAKDISDRLQIEDQLEKTYDSLTADRKNLQHALDVFADIIHEVEQHKGFDEYPFIPVSNPKIPTCWEIKECGKKDCPVYGKHNLRCWQIAGTHCGGKVQGKFAQKYASCEECEVFKMSTDDAISKTNETFNNMMHILENSQREMITARDRAEEASRVKTEFLANMSHEIRTPMNAIIGMTSLALDTQLTEEQYDYLETVRKSSYSLLNIINDILDLAKMEANKLTIDNIDFNLRLTMEGVADVLAYHSSEKKIEFAYLVHHEVPSLLIGDPARIRQILINLGNNALKFTNKGEVIIRVELVEEKDKIATVLFSVTDTGIGIPAEKQELIFDEFSQADGSTTRVYGGTGLGLSISKKLITMMGGEIGVDSEMGRGSTFWFKIPLAIQELPDIPPEVAGTDIQGSRILVADDNSTNRTILTRVIENFGCQAKAVEGGSEAIRVLKQAVREGEPFKVLILDMMMPGMDGEQTSIIIKNTPEIEDTRIIILTSLGTRGDVAELRKIGCDGYLIKPVKESLLFEAISAVISGGKDVITRHTLADSKVTNSHILLVEDNPVNQKVAAAILARAGYQVDVAQNGRDALAMLEEKKYDLVLMDIQMPEMDGHEATREIRRREEGTDRHQLVIAMTAHTLTGDREKCFASGMDDFIAKPIEPQAMLKMISDWVKSIFTPPGDLPKTKKKTKPQSGANNELTDHDCPVDMENAMKRFADDKDFYREMVQEFLSYVGGQIKRLEEATATGNAEKINSSAHSIKGAAGNLSAVKVQALALAIENMGRDKKIAEVPAAIVALKAGIAEFAEFAAAL
jgi:PAS domain S-box-containing protein